MTRWVREREILGILGPNGAGKPTVFDLMSGFTQPNSGRIYLGAADITDDPPDLWLA